MSSVRLTALAALAACAALWSATATAQVFRIVGPDGKVTFSDRPPADGRATPAQAVPLPSGGNTSAPLPAEVRAASSRYPVTLYSSAECGPCASARRFLGTRGIPFIEKTVATEDDLAALQRLSGANRLPFATIGGQQMRGFSETEWAQFLDAAGYPKVSQLPPSYRSPPATPLVAVQKPALPQQAEASEQQQQPTDAPRSVGPTPSNPAGIRF
ncbi:MAG: glutaredoxin [Ramlibacter sp.]|jgi:glutaredoxin|nr:glutaredoxin [Ramlibacter sp.]